MDAMDARQTTINEVIVSPGYLRKNVILSIPSADDARYDARGFEINIPLPVASGGHDGSAAARCKRHRQEWHVQTH